MNIETIPQDPKEIFDMKMAIQRRLIERSHIGSGEDLTAHGLNWVDEYAGRFSEVFEENLNNPNFVEMYKNDFENLVKQIETELWLSGPRESEDQEKLAA